MKKINFLSVILTAVVLISCSDKNAPEKGGEGALSGKFSVDVGKQVQFSKGNLRYQASSKTWRFADNQYDVIGEANKYMTEEYDGWIDMFGWGTGNNPTQRSIHKEDYSSFYDWGANKISNGGNVAGAWRTLRKDEWYYLFFLRDRAQVLFALGKVNGVKGTIILPDGWENPQGITFNPSTTKGLLNKGDNYFNNDNIIDHEDYIDDSKNNYSHNSYNLEQWKIMEDAGAVFLPAAGWRYCNEGEMPDIYEVGTDGLYASSDAYDDYEAYYLYFDAKQLNPQSYFSNKNVGFTVRLVR